MFLCFSLIATAYKKYTKLQAEGKESYQAWNLTSVEFAAAAQVCSTILSALLETDYTCTEPCPDTYVFVCILWDVLIIVK